MLAGHYVALMTNSNVRNPRHNHAENVVLSYQLFQKRIKQFKLSPVAKPLSGNCEALNKSPILFPCFRALKY